MKQLEQATHIRLGDERAIARLCRLGARIVATGDELHQIMLDADGHDLAPEQVAALRWTLLVVGRLTRILVVQQEA